MTPPTVSMCCRCAACGRPLAPTWCNDCLDHMPVLSRRAPVWLRIASWIVNQLGALFWWAQQHLATAETQHANKEAQP